MDKYLEVERSIIKKFRKEIWSKFTRAIRDYNLISDGDKIMVCISGGKDSFLLAKCMQEIKKHGKIDFDLKFVVMNPGYKEENDVIYNVPSKAPCYLCARMRRGHLYNKAQELGCNKIALGHHFDDVIETTLLSLFYGAEIKTMMPKLHSDNFEGIDLIRPMCYVKEKDIIAWKNYNDLKFLNCACKFTAESQIDESLSKRKEMKRLIEDLRKVNPEIDHNIYKALENVNLNCVLGFRKDGEYKSFLDDYDK